MEDAVDEEKDEVEEDEERVNDGGNAEGGGVGLERTGGAGGRVRGAAS